MLLTYLRRELVTRKRQTITVAIGMAVAVALVIVVAALSAGFRQAQDAALERVYGVGTDLSVSAAVAGPGEGGPSFEFDEGAGETDDEGTTTLEGEQLTLAMGTGTLDADAVEAVRTTDGVAATTSVLSLQSSSFSGQFMQAPTGSGDDDGTGEAGEMPAAPDGEDGGGFAQGPSDVAFDSTTVLGAEPGATLGPLASASIVDGRVLETGDEGTNVAVVSETYAASEEVGVGDAITLGGESFEVVGVIGAADGDTSSAADIVVPLDVAQALSGNDGLVSSVYVQASDASAIPAVQAEIEASLPDAQVSTQAELASTVSGSLQSASSLMTTMGTWLAIIVLVVAFALAALFTVQSVTRRTRELGTLKAVGWSNGRIVRQITAESLAQGLIGAVAGAVLGVVACVIVTAIAPEISLGGGQAQATQGGGMPNMGGMAQAASTFVLQAPVSVLIVVGAVLIAALGSALAGVLGGWRAARLQPAVALRSVH